MEPAIFQEQLTTAATTYLVNEKELQLCDNLPNSTRSKSSHKKKRSSMIRVTCWGYQLVSRRRNDQMLTKPMVY